MGETRLGILLQEFYSYKIKPKATIDSIAADFTGLKADLQTLDSKNIPTAQGNRAVLILALQYHTRHTNLLL